MSQYTSQIGLTGEDFFLRNHPGATVITSRHSQFADKDFIWNGKTYSVKFDNASKASHRIYIETLLKKLDSKDTMSGSFNKCEADFIVYYCTRSDGVLMQGTIPVNELRLFLQDKKEFCRKKGTKISTSKNHNAGRCFNASNGLTISVDYLFQNRVGNWCAAEHGIAFNPAADIDDDYFEPDE